MTKSTNYTKSCFILIVNCLAGLWRKQKNTIEVENRVFILPPNTTGEEVEGDGEFDNKPTSIFKQQYDKTQKKLEQIAAMDDLLSGRYNSRP